MPKSNHKELAKLLKTQISQTEWFSNVDHNEAVEYKLEDGQKMQRLGQLKEIIGIDYDEPNFFTSAEVLENSEKFQKFCEGKDEDLWAIRLSPLDPKLPKIRTRGPNTADAIKWIKEQDFDPDKYEIIFRPHPPGREWATAFVVNKHGIHGEITSGDHSILTQGIYWDGEPMTFSWAFGDWVMKPEVEAAAEHLMELFELLKVDDSAQRDKLEKEVDSTFSANYLNGYFESVQTQKFGIWFYDYNRMIGKMYEDYQLNFSEGSGLILTGKSASAGKASGPVRIVHPDQLGSTEFQEGEVLVCEMTTPDYLPLMKKSAAIVCDQGGILSHAAIVARELKKPCIVGTVDATNKLKDGQKVTVDGNKGEVSVLE